MRRMHNSNLQCLCSGISHTNSRSIKHGRSCISNMLLTCYYIIFNNELQIGTIKTNEMLIKSPYIVYKFIKTSEIRDDYMVKTS